MQQLPGYVYVIQQEGAVLSLVRPERDGQPAAGPWPAQEVPQQWHWLLSLLCWRSWSPSPHLMLLSQTITSTRIRRGGYSTAQSNHNILGLKMFRCALKEPKVCQIFWSMRYACLAFVWLWHEWVGLGCRRLPEDLPAPCHSGEMGGGERCCGAPSTTL